MTALAVPRAWSVLLAERATLTEQGGRLDKPLEDGWHWAQIKASQFLAIGAAFVSHSPGNGTAYPLVLTDLRRAQYENTLYENRRRFDPEKLAADPGLQAAIEKKARREASETGGAEDRYGGRLLIALPGFRAKSIAVALMDYYHLGYIGDELGLRYPDALAVAEFLTLFGEAVGQLEQADA